MNAIEKTRNKFIAVTIIAALVVLVLVFGTFVFMFYGAIRYTAFSFMDKVLSMNGIVSDSSQVVVGRDSQAFDAATEYIYVRAYKNGNSPPHISGNMTDKYSSDDMVELYRLILAEDRPEGTYGDFLYKVKDTGLQSAVCAVNISISMATLKTISFIFALVIGAAMVVIAVITLYFSRWAMRPLDNAWTKQKRFISDASHELKTPLSIITSSAQMLKYDVSPDNKWLTNIETQSALMDELIKDLLELAKLDETSENVVMEEFDLSTLVENAALEFEATAFETGREYTQNIEEGIMYKGNESMIRHLVTILVDNALKHSDEGGRVNVSLEKIRTLTENIPYAGKLTGTRPGKIILQVYNTGGGIRKEEREKIFERFYRSDESRSRATGGYGLGLSIAKTIVDTHKGEITADGRQGQWVAFTVIL